MLRPVRTVRVTTAAELDAALATADQVIVEGDDRLLSYAVNTASSDPGNRVSLEIGDHSVTVGTAGDLDSQGDGASESTRNLRPDNVRTADNPFWEPGDPDRTMIRPAPGGRRTPAKSREQRQAEEAFRRAGEEHNLRTPSLVQPRPHGPHRHRLMLVVVCLLALGLVPGLAVLWFERPGTTAFSAKPPPVAAVDPGAAAAPGVTAPPAVGGQYLSQGNLLTLVQALAWPAVTIAAITALFLVARQAIAGGRNVEISWQVTEKVSGRVVITKVRTRAQKARTAA